MRVLQERPPAALLLLPLPLALSAPPLDDPLLLLSDLCELCGGNTSASGGAGTRTAPQVCSARTSRRNANGWMRGTSSTCDLAGVLAMSARAGRSQKRVAMAARRAGLKGME